MIKKVVAKNFQSWEKLEFPIKDGVTLLSGYNFDDDNPEGSGKSASLNAICWCLFGKIPKKDVKIDDIIKEGETHCAVETFIEHHVIQSVVRSRGPNKLYMISHEDKKVQGKDIRETQKMIEEILGLSFDTYCQTQYFAQNYNKKFVSSEQSDRGKILSEIQDLQIFDRAHKETLSLLKLENSKLINLAHDKQMREVKIENNNKLIAQQQEFLNQQIKSHEDRLSRINSKILEKSTTLADVQRFISNLTQEHGSIDINILNSDLDNLTTLLGHQQAKITLATAKKSETQSIIMSQNRIKADLRDFEAKRLRLIASTESLTKFINNPSNQCNSCGSTLKDHDTSHAKNQRELDTKELQDNHKLVMESQKRLNELVIETTETIDAEIQTLTSSNVQVSQAIRSINTSITRKQTLNNQINGYQNQLPNIESELMSLNQELDIENQFQVLENTAQINDLNLQNESLQTELNSLITLYNAAQLRVSQLETLKSGFKEVKSYAFNSALNDLTTRTNTYLSELFELPILLKFTNDNMKIGIDITLDGVTRGYGLFSGGQSRRIMLAVDLALADITSMRTGNAYSFRILDEAFKDLSEASMEKCLRLLEKLGGSTILVEHNSLFKSIVDQTFEVELRDHTSRQVI